MDAETQTAVKRPTDPTLLGYWLMAQAALAESPTGVDGLASAVLSMLTALAEAQRGRDEARENRESLLTEIGKLRTFAEARVQVLVAERDALREALTAIESRKPQVIRSAMTAAGISTSISVNAPNISRMIARAALVATAPKPLYVCEKCGHHGREARHDDCNYYAPAALPVPDTPKE